MINKKQIKLVYNIFITLIMITIICCLIFISIGKSVPNDHFFNETTYTLQSDWILTNEKGETKEISLPYSINSGTYKIKTILPTNDELITNPTLEIYSNYSNLRVWLDGELIYSYPKVKPYPDGTGNTYHYLRLPEGTAGKTLEIEYQGQIGNAISYQINPIKYGSRANMLNEVLKIGLPSYLLASCMFFISLIILAFGIIFKYKKIETANFISLGLFTLHFALYIALETKFTSILIPYSEFIYTTIFVLIASFPIPLLTYLSSNINQKFTNILNGMKVLTWVNLLVQTLLHFCGVVNFRAMLPITDLVLIILMIVVIVLILLSDKSSIIKGMFAFPIAIGGLIDIILLAIKKPSHNSNLYFSMGVLIFIVAQFSIFLISYMKTYKQSIESNFMKEIAFKDGLTGAGSRTAYEHFLNIYNKDEEKKENLCCIVADINDLKIVNDTLGHSAGDIAIKMSYQSILNSFKDCLCCFRTGGDEFVAFKKLENKNQNEESIQTEISQSILEATKSNKMGFSLAVGCGIYNKDDATMEKFVMRVDQKMYQQKLNMKKMQGKLPR